MDFFREFLPKNVPRNAQTSCDTFSLLVIASAANPARHCERSEATQEATTAQQTGSSHYVSGLLRCARNDVVVVNGLKSMQ
jgi:hypothetical protein